MSFFDLENELPGWLDEVIGNYPNINEITSENIIHQLDHESQESYHMVCADKGSMVIAGREHHIWKYQAVEDNIHAYGKYLEVTGITPVLRFWIGIVVEDETITFYLWFGKEPPPAIRQSLQLSLIEEIEKGEYWYKEKPGNSGQVSCISTKCCGCGSPPLNESDLEKLKQEVKKAISVLLDAVDQAVKKI